MSEQTLDLVRAIQHRLQVVIRRITLAELTYGLVLTIGVLSALWLVLVAVEAGFWLTTTPRLLLFVGAALAAAGLFAGLLLLPALRLAGILKNVSEEEAALRIGRRFPEVSDRLVNLLQLTSGRRSETPPPLLDRAVRMLGEQVKPVPFEEVETFDRARRVTRFAALPLVALLLFVAAAPSTFLGASKRLLTPGTHYQRPAPWQLVVDPGSTELPRGGTLAIAVRSEGTVHPRSVVLDVNNLDEDRVETITLTADSSGRFHHELANVRKSLRYRVSAAPVETEWYRVEVTERPLVRGLQVALAFPGYTGIPPQRLEPNVGDVTALRGTRVSVDVGLGGRDVSEAYLRFDDGTMDTLSIEGDRASGDFLLRREGSYEVLLRNELGLENSDPIAYALRVVDDASPSIVFLTPEPDAALTEALRATLRARMTDDFGFSRLELHYRLAESRFGNAAESFSSMALPLGAPGQLDQEVVKEWLLSRESGLDPVPGDVIEYYLQVWDNDRVAGPKSARTGTQRLRLPSLAEQYEQIDAQQNTAQNQLEEMLRETETIDRQFRELRDDLRRKQEADWEDRRRVEQLESRQEQLNQRVEELSQQVKSLAEQMQENNLLSPETLEKYQELQKVVEEIRSPELMEALRKLQEAMNQLDLEQMQEAIEQFEFNEQQYQERLERSLELFKRLRAEQRLEEAEKLAEDLLRREQELEEATRRLAEERKEQNADQKSGHRREERSSDERENDRRENARPSDEQENGKEQDGKEQNGEEQREGDQREGDQREGDQREGDQREGSERPDEQRPGDEQTPDAEKLAAEQERARQDMEALLEKMRALEEQMKELRGGNQKQMQQLHEEVRQQQIPQQMQQNSQQLRNEELQKARQGQQQIQQQMQQLTQQLSQMQSEMQGQSSQINLAGLRRALSDVLTLSEQQEALRRGIGNRASGESSLREESKRQVEISENLSTVSDSLQRLSREIPQMSAEVQRQTGEALRAMSSATSAMTERSVAEVAGHQKTAMMHLNELALLLSDLMSQMMNSQGGGQGGMSMQQMMQQMQQMSQQQQQLNQQIQQFLNDTQGTRLSQEGQARLQQMQAQQEAIRQQLKQLGRDPAARGSLLGDLNRIAEQMEETIRELQRRQVDQQTITRQQQILSRLLDAQRSLRERGEEERREGQEGQDRSRQSPADLTPREEAEKLRRDLLRALESGYAPDYEELIKRYFELLQNQSRPAPTP